MSDLTVLSIAHEAPLSMVFPKQEYWSGLPFLSPWDLHHPWIELLSLHCRQILYHWAIREALTQRYRLPRLSYSSELPGHVCCQDPSSNFYQSPLSNLGTSRHWQWTFMGKTDAEAEPPILWPPDAKSQHIGKDPDTGKDWRWKDRGVTEDEVVI